ncbi:hypothetical protein LMA_08518 [Liquorilactobacillus mali KCTC 3596 = DSM 20444]|nr:hypothetical protein LMA_08518 [Liquorilactobacillus mali KCTC 3596 = DSM 20444]
MLQTDLREIYSEKHQVKWRFKNSVDEELKEYNSKWSWCKYFLLKKNLHEQKKFGSVIKCTSYSGKDVFFGRNK